MAIPVDALLRTYPRQRPPLSPGHQRHYLREYKINRTGGSLITAIVVTMEKWMHHMIARRQTGGAILELGAGTLNHLAYEREFEYYDIVEPLTALWKDAPALSRVRAHFTDISEVPTANRYDRVISVAVLEHLTHLPDVIARAGLLLRDTGVFQAGIPSEGGLLWGLAWRCVTAPAYRLRTGYDYKTLMRHEHVNTAREIITLVAHFFNNLKIWFFPLPALHLSFYIYLEATHPDRTLCSQRLNSQPSQ